MPEIVGFSIVVCTHNGSNRILPTLEAIAGLKSDLPWEVIIVNNASDDDTAAIILDFLGKRSGLLNGSLVSQPIPGLIHARRMGVSKAQYSFIVFCDDDNWLATDYLTQAASKLSGNSQIGALGGNGIPRFEGEKPDWFDQYSHSYAVGSQDWHLGQFPNKLGYLYGAGMVVRKEILRKIFDSNIKLALTGRKANKLVSGDDVEMCYLIQLMGYLLAFEPNMKFEHWLPANRVTWNNYFLLKEGIIKSAAILYAYQFLAKNRSSSSLSYLFALTVQVLKSGVIYFKNALVGKAQRKEQLLSIFILKVKFETFCSDFSRSFQHFNHLKSNF